jgi:hexosaminidase
MKLLSSKDAPMSDLFLFPMPRQVKRNGGTATLPRDCKIVIPNPNHLFSAQWFQAALAEIGIEAQIVTSNPVGGFAINLQEANLPEQAYRLTISANGISIEGKGAGLFYGLCTLRQIAQKGKTIPCLSIEDSPDFPNRGIMLDISRDKVPKVETLLKLIDDLAALKINQVQLYMEHTFAYQQHQDVWKLASAYTAEDVMIIDAYCRERFVELVPNQNSLGHMERWLKHPRYMPLAEKEDGFVPPWGGPWRPPSTVNPLDPRSFALFQELYDEFLPNFTSKQFNIGCDEPWELGQGKSKEETERTGGRVYVNWVKKLYDDLTKRGYRMMFWGDIIIHHPELVPELPSDSIVMEWGYEADHDFAGHGELFAKSGIPYYVCPGTSSWNTLIGRTDNALGNLRSAAESGLKNGAIGYLNTDWGDNGHMQPLPVSYLGFAYGAAVSWAYEANKDADVAQALSRFVYKDSSGVMGKIAYDLGNAYQELGLKLHNGQLFSYLMQVPYYRDMVKQDQDSRVKLDMEMVHQMMEKMDEILAPIHDNTMQREDASLISREILQASNLIRHGAKWMLWTRGQSDATPHELRQELDGLIMEQRAVWLERNREGGLEDSIARLHKLRSEYASALSDVTQM